MRTTATRAILLVGCIAMSGCGGGGGSGIASVGTVPPPVAPAPPPAPPPAFALLLAPPTTDQQLAVTGASYQTSATQAPMLASSDQMQVRYLASSKTYEIQLPNTQSWIGLTAKSEAEATSGSLIVSQQFANDYGSVARWWTGSLNGIEAVGIPTAAASMPVSGTATYSAWALGATSERASGPSLINPSVIGSMTLNFDFALGTLSGRLESYLDPEWHDYKLDTLSFRDTVYSSGKTTFSGKFDTALPGVNSFEGLFTGPNAQGVIGNFAVPYRSPLDGNTYQAAGAFAGKQ